LYQALEPQDEYISNEKSSRKAAGIYQVGQDGEGNRKIFFDGPAKSGNAQKKGQPKISGGIQKGTLRDVPQIRIKLTRKLSD
jgi:hypothetical protein